MILVCECGRWMHTEGVAELEENGEERWLVRSECRSCRRGVGLEAAPTDARAFVDRLLWSDEARHRLDRMPPYVQVLYTPEIEQYARETQLQVITLAILEQVRRGGSVGWAPEAERRLANVPAAVRAIARTELERTAIERGHAEVTVVLMEEVKARYFGMGARGEE